MANVISDETIEYVGILAKLELSESKKKKMPRRIWQACLIILISLMSLIQQALSLCHTYSLLNNVMREDVVTNGDGSEGYTCQCTGS